MKRYGTRIGLMGLAFLVAASLSTAPRAGDAELFADLIPGTRLSYDELGDIYGRGVATISGGTLEQLDGRQSGEFIRERLREIFARTRGAISSRSADSIANVVGGALASQAAVRANSQAAANRALANAIATRQRSLDALRARIAAIPGR